MADFGKVTRKGKREYPLRATPGTAEFKKALGRHVSFIDRAMSKKIVQRRKK